VTARVLPVGTVVVTPEKERIVDTASVDEQGRTVFADGRALPPDFREQRAAEREGVERFNAPRSTDPVDVDVVAATVLE
jgi:hypothetical protein